MTNVSKWPEDMEAAARLRGHLRKAMDDLSVNRRELADLLHVQPSNITKILAGDRIPTIGFYLRASRVLRIAPNDLLGRNVASKFDDDHNPVQPKRPRLRIQK
jgi:transcriptional regulator with XRE-family HTH domain